MQNHLQIDSPNQPPNPNNGPTAPPPPAAVSSGGPNYPQPPPPAAVSSGPPGAVPPFLLPKWLTNGGALWPRPPGPRPGGPPPSTSLTAGRSVPRLGGGVMSNDPRAFGGPSERRHGALFLQPTQVAQPLFSAPPRGGMQPYSGPPSFSAQGQGIPQQPGAISAAQRWQLQSRQIVPPPPVPGSVQPPRMYGMAPPLPVLQYMATINKKRKRTKKKKVSSDVGSPPAQPEMLDAFSAMRGARPSGATVSPRPGGSTKPLHEVRFEPDGQKEGGVEIPNGLGKADQDSESIASLKRQGKLADASSEFDKDVEVEFVKAPPKESRHAETNPIPEPEKTTDDKNPQNLEEREYIELDDDVATSLATLATRYLELRHRTQILKGSLVEGLNQNRALNETIEGMKQSVGERDVLRQRVIELEGELAREKEGRRVSDERLALMKQILNGKNADPPASY